MFCQLRKTDAETKQRLTNNQSISAKGSTNNKMIGPDKRRGTRDTRKTDKGVREARTDAENNHYTS